MFGINDTFPLLLRTEIIQRTNIEFLVKEGFMVCFLSLFGNVTDELAFLKVRNAQLWKLYAEMG